jgi:hypothetical protein
MIKSFVVKLIFAYFRLLGGLAFLFNSVGRSIKIGVRLKIGEFNLKNNLFLMFTLKMNS